MQRPNHYLILIFTCLVVLSCDKKIDFAEYKEFDNVHEVLDGLEEIRIDTDLFTVIEMVAGDNILFIMSNEEDSVVRLFDNKSLDYLGAYGKVGQGPGDFFYPYQDGFRIQKGDVLTMMDRKSIRKLRFAFENGKVSLENEEYHKHPGLMIPLREGSFLNDSTIIGLNQPINDFQFIFNDFENDTITHGFDYPPIEFRGSLFEKKGEMNSFMKVSRDGSKIAMAYNKLPLIRIIDLERNSNNQIYVKTEEGLLQDYLTDSDGYPIEDVTYFYFDLAVSDQYIFAGYEKHKNIYHESKPAESVSLSEHEIHVLDFEGNLKARIIIEDWMREYAVLPNSEYLIFCHPEKERSLFRYKLSNIL